MLTIVASLAVVVGLAFAGGSARAATATVSPTGGHFTLTLSASDLGIAPSYLQAVVTQVNAGGASLSTQLERSMQEYSGDFASAGVANTDPAPNFDPTLSMTSDGTGLVSTFRRRRCRPTPAGGRSSSPEGSALRSDTDSGGPALRS